jgi:Transglycosylase-like domain/Putative peptidoglycan binding domain
LSPTGSDAAALRARCESSLNDSRKRRELARRLRLRRFRVRGSVLSLAAVALCVAVAGAGFAVAESGQTVTSVKRGDRGPAVVQIQKKLGISADGVFGPQTERAVKRFQRRKGLTVDGVVGPQTREALGLPAFSARSVRRSGTGGSSVRTRSGVKVPRILQRIAECESGGNPRAIGGGGRYRGKYQFSMSTWRAYGGKGDPVDASEAEQDRIAVKLYRARGTSPWPNCA